MSVLSLAFLMSNPKKSRSPFFRRSASSPEFRAICLTQRCPHIRNVTSAGCQIRAGRIQVAATLVTSPETLPIFRVRGLLDFRQLRSRFLTNLGYFRGIRLICKFAGSRCKLRLGLFLIGSQFSANLREFSSSFVVTPRRFVTTSTSDAISVVLVLTALI